MFRTQIFPSPAVRYLPARTQCLPKCVLSILAGKLHIRPCASRMIASEIEAIASRFHRFVLEILHMKLQATDATKVPGANKWWADGDVMLNPDIWMCRNKLALKHDPVCVARP